VNLPASEPETGCERLRRVLDGFGEPVQHRPVSVEYVGDGRVEQLLLAVEVVVERTHPDGGGLGDLQDGHVDLSLGDQPLRGSDQRRSGALFAPRQAVGRLTIAHRAHLQQYASVMRIPSESLTER
jgi:hypothetical protein